MLRRVNPVSEEGLVVRIGDSSFPPSFRTGLEYAAPARGTWNIVHTGMLIPESHQIFVCAESCLRGVVLTAAEMGAQDRFSMINIRGGNIIDGMEDLIIDGVGEIIAGLKYRPRCFLVYTSCVHHFIGCDLPLVYRTLRERYPEFDFVSCFMNPIMRKSGLTPDQLMRRGLYKPLRETKKDEKRLNIIGNDFATDRTSEIRRIISGAGYSVSEIQDFDSYDGYLSMSEASGNIVFGDAALAGGKDLEKRLGQKLLYLPYSYDYGRMTENYRLLCEHMGCDIPDLSADIEAAEKAVKEARSVVGDMPVAIDYTMTYKPLGLARFLCERGFNIARVYADGYTADEKDDFERLKALSPGTELWATVEPRMRAAERTYDGKILALGQKAAYFTGTDLFVNVVENGGMYGIDGIRRTAGYMIDAVKHPKEAKSFIQQKGLGCRCVFE